MAAVATQKPGPEAEIQQKIIMMKQDCGPIDPCIHDPQRRAALSQGGPIDHVGFVSLANNPDFDLKKTVFGNLPGPIAPAFMKTKIGNIQYWQEKRLKAIETAYQKNVEEKDGENE
jgi:hypothetical protein